MVIFGSKLHTVPIIGLSTGVQIGTAERPVIDWTCLKIVGLICTLGKDSDQLLLIQDIREYTAEVILVNSEDAFIAASEVIRLQFLLNPEFQLISAPVKTEAGSKLGQVSDYTFDPKTFEVQQLHLKRPIIRAIMSGGLVIHRRQIVEVAPPTIIVRDTRVKDQIAATQPVS